jgi:hypothetical protein
MASKRQTTMAKIAREQAVRERRARKQEKRDRKRAAKANPETAAAADGPAVESGTEATP